MAKKKAKGRRGMGTPRGRAEALATPSLATVGTGGRRRRVAGRRGMGTPRGRAKALGLIGGATLSDAEVRMLKKRLPKLDKGFFGHMDPSKAPRVKIQGDK